MNITYCVFRGVDKANAESFSQITNAEGLSQVANAQRLSQVANKKPSVDQEQPKGGVLLENEGYQLRNKRHFQKGKSIRDPGDEGSRMLQRKSLRQNCKSLAMNFNVSHSLKSILSNEPNEYSQFF